MSIASIDAPGDQPVGAGAALAFPLSMRMRLLSLRRTVDVTDAQGRLCYVVRNRSLSGIDVVAYDDFACTRKVFTARALPQRGMEQTLHIPIRGPGGDIGRLQLIPPFRGAMGERKFLDSAGQVHRIDKVRAPWSFILRRSNGVPLLQLVRQPAFFSNRLQMDAPEGVSDLERNVLLPAMFVLATVVSNVDPVDPPIWLRVPG